VPLPEVSVVLPFRNGARFLGESMLSILRQTLHALELIAIDDGSTDGARQLAERIAATDERVKVVSGRGSGLVDALNLGLDMARGPYVARMDADDIAEGPRLQCSFETLEANLALVVLGTAAVLIDQDGVVGRTCRPPLRHGAILLAARSGIGPAMVHPSVMMRTRAVREVGGYRAHADVCEDLDLWLRLGAIGRLGNLRTPLLRLRKHTGNVTLTRWQDAMTSRIIVLAAERLRRAGRLDPLECTTCDWRGYRECVRRLLIRRRLLPEAERTDQVGRNASWTRNGVQGPAPNERRTLGRVWNSARKIVQMELAVSAVVKAGPCHSEERL